MSEVKTPRYRATVVQVYPRTKDKDIKSTFGGVPEFTYKQVRQLCLVQIDALANPEDFDPRLAKFLADSKVGFKVLGSKTLQGLKEHKDSLPAKETAKLKEEIILYPNVVLDGETGEKMTFFEIGSEMGASQSALNSKEDMLLETYSAEDADFLKKALAEMQAV